MGASGSGGGAGATSGEKGGNATAESPGTITDTTADAKLGTIVSDETADETDSFGTAAERVGIEGSAIGIDPISGRETNSGAMKSSGSKALVGSGASSAYLGSNRR